MVITGRAHCFHDNIYNIIYISGHKWSTTHRVLKSHRSKMSVIYMLWWKQCALTVIATMTNRILWIFWKNIPYIMCPSAWVTTKPLWWQPGGHIVFMITYIILYIYIYIYIYYIYIYTYIYIYIKLFCCSNGFHS